LAPIYDQLADAYDGNKFIQIAKIDMDQSGTGDISSKHGIQGYPTLKLFKKVKHTEQNS